jgi:hypothetical protein
VWRIRKGYARLCECVGWNVVELFDKYLGAVPINTCMQPEPVDGHVGGNLAAITIIPRRNRYKINVPYQRMCTAGGRSEKSSASAPTQRRRDAAMRRRLPQRHVDAHNATVSPPSSRSITTNSVPRSLRSSPCFFCDDGRPRNSYDVDGGMPSFFLWH